MCARFWQLLFFLANSALIYFPEPMLSLLEEVFQTQTINSSSSSPIQALHDQLDRLHAPFLEFDNWIEKSLVSISSDRSILTGLFPLWKCHLDPCPLIIIILVVLKLAFSDFGSFFKVFYFIFSFCELKQLCHSQQNKWRKTWTKYNIVPDEIRNDEIRIKIFPFVSIQWVIYFSLNTVHAQRLMHTLI